MKGQRVCGCVCGVVDKASKNVISSQGKEIKEHHEDKADVPDPTKGAAQTDKNNVGGLKKEN